MNEFGRGKRWECGVFDDAIPISYLNDITECIKKYPSISEFVDEFNSIGCTSFRLTSEQIKELLEP